MAITFNHNDKLYVNGSNVGIGTNSPVQPLTVQAATNANTIGLLGRSSDNNSRIDFLNNVGNSRILTVLAYDSANQIYGDTNIPLTISTNAAERMRITGGGNVGINTSNPGERLDVVGNIRSYSAANNYGQIQNGSFLAVGNHGGTFMLDLDNNGTADLVNIKKSGTSRFYIENGGNVGIGTTNPVSKLHVVGEGDTVTLQKSNNVPALAFLGTSTNKSVIEGGDNFNFYTGGSSRLYIANGGNVGIGTTSPAYTLDVEKDVDTWVSRIYNTGSDANAQTLLVRSDATAAHDATVLGVYADSGYKMVVKSTGNVGIGTTSPGNKFHIKDGASGFTGTFDSRYKSIVEANGEAYYATYVPDNSFAGIRFNDTSGLKGYIDYYHGTQGDALAYSATNHHRFSIGSLEKMRLSSAGNLGIGTTSPAYKIHVEGTGYISDDLLVGIGNASSWHRVSIQTGGFVAQSGTKGIGVYSDANANSEELFAYDYTASSYIPLKIRTSTLDIVNGTGSTVLHHNGTNVGIGTTSPKQRLDVSGDGGKIAITNTSTTNYSEIIFYEGSTVKADIWVNGSAQVDFAGANSMNIWQGSNAPIAFYTNGTNERMRITSSGNVGIGTSSPGAKLDVAGQVSLDSDLFIGADNGANYTASRIRLYSHNNYRGAGMHLTGVDSNWFVGTPYTDFSGSFVIARKGVATSEEDTAQLSNALLTLSSSGNLGIGTTSPDAKLHINSSVSDGIILRTTANVEPFIAIQRNSGSNGVAVLRSIDGGHLYVDTGATGAAQSTKMTVTAGGNVGIGTTSPAQKLHVAGNAQVTGQFAQGVNVADKIAAYGAEFRSSGASAQIFFGRSDSAVGSGAIGADASYVFSVWNVPSFSRPFVINQDENVGIGTTSPSRKLTVSDSGAANGSQNITAQFGNVTVGATSSAIYIGAYTGTDWLIGKNIYGTSNHYNFEIGNQASGSSPVISINNSNNVGIGTTSPSTKLDVRADAPSTSGSIIYVRNTLADGSNSTFGGISFFSTPGADYTIGKLNTGSASALAFRNANNGTEYMRINPDGHVGIGTTAPTWKFVVSNSGGIGFEVDPDDGLTGKVGLYAYNRSSSAYVPMRLEASSFDFNNSIGIGTASPNTFLHIAGQGNRSGGHIYLGNQDDGSTKYSLITSAHYNAATEPEGFTLITGLSTATENTVSIGGFVWESNPATDIRFFTHTATTHTTGGSERMRIISNGNVGIGTTSPISELHVVGSARVVTNDSAGGDTLIGAINGISNGYRILTNTSNEITYSWNTGDNVQAVTINNSGNVGIGTTSPGAKLTVAGAGGSTKGTDGYLVHIGGTDSSVDPVRYMIGFSHGDTYTAGNVRAAIGSLITTGGNGNLVFETGGAGAGQTERMRITGSGNVSIGTTSPAGPLTVQSDSGAASISVVGRSSDSISSFDFYNTTKSAAIYIQSNGSYLRTRAEGGFHFAKGTTPSTADTNAFTVEGLNVGIGTTSPVSTLDVVSSGINIYRATDTSSQYRWRVDQNFDMFMTNSSGVDKSGIKNDGSAYFLGNVGIGTTGPNQKLHVEGAIYAGTANSTSGSLILVGKYNNGNIITIGGEYSNGGIVIGYGVKPSTTAAGAFLSSSALANLERGAYTQVGSEHRWWSGAYQTVAEGGAVTMSRTMTLDGAGNLGIGTTSPDAHLHVSASSDAHLLIESDNTISFYQDAAWSSTMMFGAKWNGTNEVYGATTRGAFKMVALHDADNSPQYLAIYGANHGTAGGTVTWNTVGFAQDEDGNVGIGTTSPGQKLDVNGTIRSTANEGKILINSTATNGKQYEFISIDTGNLGLYDGTAYRLWVSGAGNIGIGTTSPQYKLTVSSGTADIGILTASSDSGSYVGFLDNATSTIPKVGAVGNKLILDASQYVGVRRTDPSYALDVSGTIRATGDVIAYSDARVKENVETIPNALEKVKAMRGVGYNKIGEQKRSIGVIAQEMLEVMPEVVSQDEQGMYSVAYGNLVGVLVEAMKEQQKQIDELKAQLDVIAS